MSNNNIIQSGNCILGDKLDWKEQLSTNSDLRVVSEEVLNLRHKLDELRPYSKELTQQIKRFFNTSITYSSNALEGNTLTEAETRILIEDGLTVAGKPLKDTLEVIGHNDAMNFIFEYAEKDTIKLTDILKLHYLFYNRIDSKNAGVYRKIPVFISNKDNLRFPPPTQISDKMKKFETMIPELKKHFPSIAFSALMMANLVSIHPFIDGNGRVARLLMNLALIQDGYIPIAIPNIVRQEYLKACFSANSGDALKLITFVYRRMKIDLIDFLKLLEN